MTEPESGNPNKNSDSDHHFSLIAQLKERRVYRAAATYAVVAWGVTEILDGIIAGLGWPDWLATLAVILFVMGFPAAMFLAWVYDWTPDGIRRTEPAGAMGWLPAVAAAAFLILGTAGLFWLINPSGIARAETTSVAVLPCRYRGDPAFSYRGDGFADVISTRMAYSEHLFVPAFGSVRQISASGLDTGELGERLGVSWLIECRITDQDGILNIETSIVDVETNDSSALIGFRVESLEILETLNRIETELFARLGISLDHSLQETLNTFLTSSLGAFDEYLIGQEAMRTGTSEGYEKARIHYRYAQRAGEFPLARLGEANALLNLLELTTPDQQLTRLSMLRAVDLILDQMEIRDPAPAESYATRLRQAILANHLGVSTNLDVEQCEEWFNRAIELRPSFAEPYSLYADCLESQGRSDQTGDLRARALQLAPGAP